MSGEIIALSCNNVVGAAEGRLCVFLDSYTVGSCAVTAISIVIV